jgi:hypothetical protein
LGRVLRCLAKNKKNTHGENTGFIAGVRLAAHGRILHLPERSDDEVVKDFSTPFFDSRMGESLNCDKLGRLYLFFERSLYFLYNLTVRAK